MARRKLKKKPYKRKAPRVKGMMTVPDAAEFLYMTCSGVYAAIKRGEVSSKRVEDRVLVPRDDVRAFHKRRMDFYFPKPKTQKQLDEEFLREMWENDPD